MFITVFKTARHWILPWASWTQPSPSLRCILSSVRVASHLCLHSLMELSPSWEAASCAATQEIPQRFMEPEDSVTCSLVRPGTRFFVIFHNKLIFLRWGVVSPTPNPQAGGSPLVGCPLLLIHYIRSCPPYLEATTSFRNLRPRHAVVTRDPLNMAVFPAKNFYSFLFHPRYMPSPAHLPLCEHNILWITKIM
jgi:hypothetical protein